MIKKIYIKYKVKKEGGNSKSTYLRNLFRKKYNVNVGMYSYGGCFAKDFNIGGKVNIGRYCSIANNVHYFGANHPIHYASTSPYFYNKSFGFNIVNDVRRSTLEIGNDVWIGYGVIITSNCKKIGNGAIIGAGSIVTKDVPPYSIVVGNPACIKKYRFNNDTIENLEKSQWWKYSPEQLLEYYDDIDNPKLWCSKLSQLGKK